MTLSTETEIQKADKNTRRPEAHIAHDPHHEIADPQGLASCIRKRITLRQRLKPIGALRKFARGLLFGFVKKLARTDDAREIAADALIGLSALESKEVVLGLNNEAPPYTELGHATAAASANGGEVIIITARFRTGSTLLWNLFRNIEGVTAYYEPFNERRWFDPTSRGNRIDETHRGVYDYWGEYHGLEELGNYYREEWTYRNLFMSADMWNPQMKRFIGVLIEKARGRPVLQFNRIDFRLPWIKHNFPHAKIVHLYRNPRDQWCSSLMDLRCFPKDGKMPEFGAHDKFYLLNWANDLKYHFPFLDPRAISHPYQLYYYIWKLSYLFGIKFAHHSIRFEALVEKPDAQLIEMFSALNIHNADVGKLTALVMEAEVGKWRDYADDAWFRQHESDCEDVLGHFLNLPSAKTVATVQSNKRSSQSER